MKAAISNDSENENMDGVSAAASIIAVIQISQTVATILKDYYTSVRDARKDIQRLYNAVNSLEAIVTCIKDLDSTYDGRFLSSPLLQNPQGPLQQSKVELECIRNVLGPPASTRKKLESAARSLKWPFHKKDIEKIISVIDGHVSRLSLQIGMENL
jgi:hypothetical protein